VLPNPIRALPVMTPLGAKAASLTRQSTVRSREMRSRDHNLADSRSGGLCGSRPERRLARTEPSWSHWVPKLPRPPKEKAREPMGFAGQVEQGGFTSGRRGGPGPARRTLPRRCRRDMETIGRRRA
jgi:hypothetical protein